MCNDGYIYDCQERCPYNGYCSDTEKEAQRSEYGCNNKTFYDWVMVGFDNMIISGGKAREILRIDCGRWFDMMKATGRKYNAE